MSRRNLLIAYRLAFALLALAAVVAQVVISTGRPTFSLANFLSFFTIESNLLAAGVFLAGAAASSRDREVSPTLRGAALIAMTMTGIIYTLLLSGLEESLQTATPWVNTVLHYVMPVVVVIDWLVDQPARRLALRDAAVWLAFPLAYVAYSLLRGPLVDWYPYPFLDPRDQGYAAVALTSTVIALLVVAAVLAVVWLTNLPDRRRRAG